MSLIVKIILILIFDSYSIFMIVPRIIYIIGSALMLKKSGLKWYYSLFPWFREYQLSRCAYREYEGRIYCILCFLSTIFTMLEVFFDIVDDYYASFNIYTYLYMILTISILLAVAIFNIRIFNGFIQIYGLKKPWILLGFARPLIGIAMLILGLSKNILPKWKVEDIKVEMSNIVKYGAASNMDSGLSVRIASRSVNDFFKKKYLLKDIHIEIPTGHMVLLLGGSGAGKTTFINAINGYEKADAKVMLDGHDMYSEYNKMKHNVGFVPQPLMMRNKDTVKKTMYDAAKIRLPKDISHDDKINRVSEVMDTFGLLPVQDSLVEKLSGGQKKRLSICMELLSNPSLFILDEPDSGLDGVMSRELFARLREIADNNKIVIVITHSPDRVVDFFDDVIVLAKDKNRTGRLAYFGTIDDAREFFKKDSMDEIVKIVNQTEEGGEGRAEEYIGKYERLIQHG